MSLVFVKWLLFTLLAIVVQAFFALFEMACVSFNKVRLQYYVSRGEKRAAWIHFLLRRPSRLFGTTLIGINTALQMGSECARKFYESIHLDPDWAPLSQVIIVVIFAELVPLFTARRHPERIALCFAPVMIFLAKILTPITWTFDQISKGIHRLMSKPKDASLFLSREEVMMAFEESDRGEDEFNRVMNAIFQLKNLTAKELMQPLSKTVVFPSSAVVEEVRAELPERYVPILPIYHRVPYNIVSVVALRDLLVLGPRQKIIDQGKSPWFVTKDTSILQILDQFRRNNQSIAVILESSGQACGFLTLDQIVDAIFGQEERSEGEEAVGYFVERTLSGGMMVEEFNRQFKADLHGEGTLSDWLLAQLDHPPSKDEVVRAGEYEFVLIEPTLRGIKTVKVRSTI